MKKSFVEIDIEKNKTYLNLLTIVGKLSRLFSDSQIPYLYYRLAENIFCKSFDAQNLSRTDTAFDAKIANVGIGLKTFITQKNIEFEKIAEFNKVSNEIKKLDGKDLAQKISQVRNDRISLAKRFYNIDESIYHIIARKENKFLLYETKYSNIEINNIKVTKNTKSSLVFNDSLNEYSYNYSKSTLYGKFEVPRSAFELPINILDDPYETLLRLLKAEDLSFLSSNLDFLEPGKNYVILPLYGYNKGQKFVFPRSGLNQWNARGRKRDIGEVYIPIPSIIHKKHPNFFPKRDREFNLQIPTGENLVAKVCQDNSKALMTNPNNALSDWLLRKVLMLKEEEEATIEKMYELGFDSVMITRIDNENYKIDKSKVDNFELFIAETKS